MAAHMAPASSSERGSRKRAKLLARSRWKRFLLGAEVGQALGKELEVAGGEVAEALVAGGWAAFSMPAWTTPISYNLWNGRAFLCRLKNNKETEWT
jgi:hypothetical protein